MTRATGTWRGAKAARHGATTDGPAKDKCLKKFAKNKNGRSHYDAARFCLKQQCLRCRAETGYPRSG